MNPRWFAVELFCLLSLVDVFSVSANGGTAGDDDATAWAKFKLKLRKHYKSHQEEMTRFNQWLNNRVLIRQHNIQAAASGYILGDNEFSDWSRPEYEKLLGYRSSSRSQYDQLSSGGRLMPTMKPNQHNVYNQTVDLSTLPPTVNWTAQGAVNPVQNQGQCGDCWAFSACGALEGLYFLTTGSSAVMSEQNLVDCTTNYGNLGCNGGSMNAAFEYVQQNKGIDTFASYPYTAADGTCHYSSSTSVGYSTDYKSILTGSEGALQQAVALIGPVSVGIDAGQPSFQLYKSGVYSSPKCSSHNLDHAVLAVGYGTYNGSDYWLLKNSWGTSWGMNGYMMMARNDNNMCGIATDASFPTGFVASGYTYEASSSSSSLGHFQYFQSLVVVLLLKLLR